MCFLTNSKVSCSRMLIIISFILLTFMVLPKSNADIVNAESADKYIVLNRGDIAIKIDASFDDWKTATNVLYMGEKTWEPVGVGTGTWDGPNDLSAELRVVYDKSNLYFALQVKDDEYLAKGAGFWDNDGPQMAIDSSAGKIAAGWPNKTTHLYNFSIKDGWNKEIGPFLGDAEFKAKRDDTTKQNLYEWIMPVGIIAAAGTELKAGMEIAFAIIINDSDINAPGQAGWIGWGNRAIVFGKKPEIMKTLSLSDKSIGSATAVTSQSKITATWGSLKK